MDRVFKGVWIPSDIWLSKELTLIEKLFLVEIDSLDNELGCYASNAHFSEFFDLSKNRCSEIISSLANKNKIVVSYYRENNSIRKRVLKVSKGVFEKSIQVFGKSEAPIRDIEEGYSENCKGNNTSINNTIRESNALTFLEENYPSVFESLLLKYKSKIKDFQKASNDFNLKFDVENHEYSVKIINARAQLFFNRWIENENKFNQNTSSGFIDKQNDVYKQTRF